MRVASGKNFAFAISIASLILYCDPGAAQHGNNPEDVLDHFVCYTFKDKKIDAPAGIALLDQFYEKAQPTKVITRELLCNPAGKKHKASEKFPELKHPEAHLVCYKIEDRTVSLTLKVANQVDTKLQNLQVIREHYLCLPSGKQLVPNPKRPPEKPPAIPSGGVLDHFKCYDVTAEKYSDKYYEWKDEFGNYVFRNDIRAEIICNPVEKLREGEKPVPRKNPTAHLVCYSLFKLEKFDRVVKIANQFEPSPKPRDLLTVNSVPRFICMPSTKEIISSD
jgi:hypothetical protein